MSESSPKKRAVSSLDQLKSMTVVVADTGDFAGKCKRYWTYAILGSVT